MRVEKFESAHPLALHATSSLRAAGAAIQTLFVILRRMLAESINAIKLSPLNNGDILCSVQGF